jgi:hypothetical protein
LVKAFPLTDKIPLFHGKMHSHRQIDKLDIYEPDSIAKNIPTDRPIGYLLASLLGEKCSHRQTPMAKSVPTDRYTN